MIRRRPTQAFRTIVRSTVRSSTSGDIAVGTGSVGSGAVPAVRRPRRRTAGTAPLPTLPVPTAISPEVLERTVDRTIVRKACVGLLRIIRLLVDAGAVAARDLVHGIADATAGTARAHGQHDARRVTGADEDVLRPRRAVHEVPGAQAALLAFDQEQALAG